MASGYKYLLIAFSPSKDSGDDAEALPDERILAPGLTIVEEEGSLSAADLGGHSGPNESM